MASRHHKVHDDWDSPDNKRVRLTNRQLAVIVAVLTLLVGGMRLSSWFASIMETYF